MCILGRFVMPQWATNTSWYQALSFLLYPMAFSGQLYSLQERDTQV